MQIIATPANIRVKNLKVKSRISTIFAAPWLTHCLNWRIRSKKCKKKMERLKTFKNSNATQGSSKSKHSRS